MNFIIFRTQWPSFSPSSGSDMIQGLAVPKARSSWTAGWRQFPSFAPAGLPVFPRNFRHFEGRACLGGPRSLQATVAGHTVRTNVTWRTAGWLGLLDLEARRLFPSLASPSKQPSAFTFLGRQKMLGGQRRRGMGWCVQQGSHSHSSFHWRASSLRIGPSGTNSGRRRGLWRDLHNSSWRSRIQWHWAQAPWYVMLSNETQIWKNVYPLLSILRKLTATEHQLQVTFVSKHINIWMHTYILFYKQPPT